jgi:hypothetical protein
MGADLTEADDWRGNLRLPKEVHAAIVARTKKRAGSISVNTWILEAIVERLQNEESQGIKASEE